MPTVRSMSEAIEMHVSTHMGKTKNSVEEEIEADRLRDALIEQFFNLILRKISDSEKEEKF